MWFNNFYENIGIQGVQIIMDLINRLAGVDKALTALYGVLLCLLTIGNIQENLIAGHDTQKVSHRVSRRS